MPRQSATQESWRNNKGKDESRTEWHRVYAWQSVTRERFTSTVGIAADIIAAVQPARDEHPARPTVARLMCVLSDSISIARGILVSPLPVDDKQSNA